MYCLFFASLSFYAYCTLLLPTLGCVHMVICIQIFSQCLLVASWFHGKISGPEAVCKLRPVEDGLFLVRESIRHPGDYVLCVSVSGEVIHYRVMYRNNKLTIDNTQYFYNLIDMIEVRVEIH